MKNQNNVRRVEIYDVNIFPINSYIIEECVLLEELPENSIVYLQDARLDIERCLIKLKKKNEGLCVYMSYKTFFQISYSCNDYEYADQRDNLHELYESACCVKYMLSTFGNHIKYNYPNITVINKDNEEQILNDLDFKNFETFFKNEAEEFVDLLEDLTFVMKIDNSTWLGFDSSIREQMEKDHIVKEVKDKIELYHKIFEFEI